MHTNGRHTPLSHIQALLRELAASGTVTYEELCARYPDLDYHGFTAAAMRAREAGWATGPETKGGAIVAAGCCPYCGRQLP